ncbi:hypothetical protein RHMOL_Rhmol02G0065100 [Rhododendron molle]|uniref:Uncharacterized protein n=1 Tax=Rhododendron molle TaxID=49168 RepID=A0ACC0PNL7_RHOML|nr:hypothetical protein RHMOL_Rhmol02G0065100 [Rhododendron molle]
MGEAAASSPPPPSSSPPLSSLTFLLPGSTGFGRGFVERRGLLGVGGVDRWWFLRLVAARELVETSSALNPYHKMERKLDNQDDPWGHNPLNG